MPKTVYGLHLYSLIQACTQASGEIKTTLTHALVLALSGNREFNLTRRELLRSDLNTQYVSLRSPSTPITTELFGDDIGKQIEDVAKNYQNWQQNFQFSQRT